MKPNQIKLGDTLVVIQAADVVNDGEEAWANIGLANNKGIRYEHVIFRDGKFQQIDFRPAKYTDNQIIKLDEFNEFMIWNQSEILALIEKLCENIKRPSILTS